MFDTEDLIESIFDNIQQMSIDNLSKRVIVAPTNAETLEMNRKIISLIPGDSEIYYSADSAVTDNPNFPVEFLRNASSCFAP